MAGGGVDDGSTYSPKVGAIYVFNLIVGAGALGLPKAFSEAGYIAGSILLLILAILSFMTVTFMVESMAIGNAITKLKATAMQSIQQPAETDLLLPSKPTESSSYSITKRMEMAALAELFFNKTGVKLFYLCMIIYLYGDLCIYAVAVPKSLQSVVCGTNSTTAIVNGTHLHQHDCMGSLDRDQTYYVFLAVFSAILGPFCFFNAQKTKLLQITTTLFRWATFSIMIIIAIIGIAQDKGFDSTDIVPKSSDVSVATFAGMPVLFGVSIYAFMCHHSLPSLVTPINDKRRLTSMFVFDFMLVFAFYCLLSFTAVFRFEGSKLESLYTLDFQKFKVKAISYFLQLFPVFTLSANFPIIAITLRNNLRHLFENPEKPFHPFITQFVFTIATIAPPIIVAFFTKDVELLISFTGSYAGCAIQYVIPAMLCYSGRRMASRLIARDEANPHRSWFSSKLWIVFILVWSIVCVSIVTYNHIRTKH